MRSEGVNLSVEWENILFHHFDRIRKQIRLVFDGNRIHKDPLRPRRRGHLPRWPGGGECEGVAGGGQVFIELTWATAMMLRSMTGMKTPRAGGMPGMEAEAPRTPPMREMMATGAHLRDWTTMFFGSRVM